MSRDSDPKVTMKHVFTSMLVKAQLRSANTFGFVKQKQRQSLKSWEQLGFTGDPSFGLTGLARQWKPR